MNESTINCRVDKWGTIWVPVDGGEWPVFPGDVVRCENTFAPEARRRVENPSPKGPKRKKRRKR